ncbi:hypothetical protein T265_07712 [Opisthorchis viverrini]|uniref:NADH dehydrogenase [ubiquinone] iron-sulfur protein 4, mitochondrial n=1 Tax=Opisthorchis viverrini TaxID=6198 RepID=A0A075AAU6_OPIVI|nr:hypothetical protein T265_07712 [Opisthorchis viverrini]KER24664.1 hypothetical protein T265_07712 [Opisthorchis viverrini]
MTWGVLIPAANQRIRRLFVRILAAASTLLRAEDIKSSTTPFLHSCLSGERKPLKDKNETDPAEHIMRKADDFSKEDRIVVPKQADLTRVNGVPEEHQSTRRVRIYIPARSVTQSGDHGTRLWRLDFDNRERWENPLMGWASSGDPLSNVSVEFETPEAAVDFCQRQGWPCYVEEPNLPKMRIKSYGANFSWNKRTRVATK